MAAMTSGSPRRVEFTDGLPVGVRSFLVSGKGRILNLSATGAYLATPLYLLPQARIHLKVVLLEEKRWIETDAVVVWENRGTVGRRDGLPPGYGIRFVDTTMEAQRVIHKLLSGPGVEPEAAPATETAAIQTVSTAGAEELDGPPFRLRKDVIKKCAPAKVPGVFVLSYDRTQDARVGRTDEDLRATLASFEGEYAYFYFEAIEPPDERYFRECELYHRLGGDNGQLDNTSHPVPPPEVHADCPVCAATKSPK